jgi:hypothetical protein
MDNTLTLPGSLATPNPTKAVLWTGRILSGLAVAFLAVDAAMKVLAVAPVVEASTKLGFSASAVQPIGLALLVATILFAIPRTAVIGAMFVTTYLGGATATMVLAGQPIYFPIVFGVVVWASLLLRRPQLRAILLPSI